MVYNKIIANNQTVLDISEDTVDSDKVLRGISFHKNSGEKASGTIETYAGDTNVTENKVLPTAGTYLNSDITVNVSGSTGSTKVAPEYVSFKGYNGTSLDLSWLDTSQMTQFDYMFSGCSWLSSLDLRGFNTSKAQSMYGMFNGCGYLTRITFGSNFETSNITNMYQMFAGCSRLTHLGLNKFNTSNVTNMSYMFNECSSLTRLDLSNFDFTNVTSYDDMFTDVPADCEILVKDEASKTWITSKFSNLTNVKIKAQ